MGTVFVVARDRDLRHLLKRVIEERGWGTQLFAGPEFCRVTSSAVDRCPNDHPCCDALIMDYEASWMTGLDLIERHRQKGCKVSPSRKAFLAVAPDCDLGTKARETACRMIPKPFRLQMIHDWLAGCEDQARPAN